MDKKKVYFVTDNSQAENILRKCLECMGAQYESSLDELYYEDVIIEVTLSQIQIEFAYSAAIKHDDLLLCLDEESYKNYMQGY